MQNFSKWGLQISGNSPQNPSDPFQGGLKHQHIFFCNDHKVLFVFFCYVDICTIAKAMVGETADSTWIKAVVPNCASIHILHYHPLAANKKMPSHLSSSALMANAFLIARFTIFFLFQYLFSFFPTTPAVSPCKRFIHLIPSYLQVHSAFSGETVPSLDFIALSGFLGQSPASLTLTWQCLIASECYFLIFEMTAKAFDNQD